MTAYTSSISASSYSLTASRGCDKSIHRLESTRQGTVKDAEVVVWYSLTMPPCRTRATTLLSA